MDSNGDPIEGALVRTTGDNARQVGGSTSQMGWTEGILNEGEGFTAEAVGYVFGSASPVEGEARTYRIVMQVRTIFGTLSDSLSKQWM